MNLIAVDVVVCKDETRGTKGVNIFFNSIENVLKKSAPQNIYVTFIIIVQLSNECLNCL